MCQELAENPIWTAGRSRWCCLSYQYSDLEIFPWFQCWTTYCKTANDANTVIVTHVNTNRHSAKTQHWYHFYLLWGVLKETQDWRTSCCRHRWERRTCWWKDGSGPAVVWCGGRHPVAAWPSPRPKTGPNQQLLIRRLQNMMILTARSETLKKGDDKGRVSRVLRVTCFCVCVSYVQNVVQRVQPE